jgi:hypothetical protein
MEHEGSLPDSQEPATGPYPESHKSSPQPPKGPFNIILPSTPRSTEWYLL